MTAYVEGSIRSSAPFDAIAESYDDLFSNSPIGRAQRRIVWEEMDRVFQCGQRVLELNCGTGIDAVHLSLRGIHVEACDSAPAMIAVAEKRAAALSYLPVRFRCLPTERIHELLPDGPFDGVLSNFSGLNCLSDLTQIALPLSKLVKDGGRFVVCVFGTFCLWEVVWYLLSGKPEKAFRRLRSGEVKSTLAPGASVFVRYWSVSSLQEAFAPYFRLERRRGVGVISPPSYAAAVALKFPRLFRATSKLDSIVGACPALRLLADHVVLTFIRTAGDNS